MEISLPLVEDPAIWDGGGPRWRCRTPLAWNIIMAEVSRKIERLHLKPSLLVEQVSLTLAEAIMEGVLKGGDQLVEAELQKQFGISRSPIREAFRILERKGLVVITPRRGTFVKKITTRDVEENFPVRAYLEGLAARLAVPRLTAQDIQKMQKALTRMEEVSNKKDYSSYMKHHLRFHETFIEACGNDTLIRILRNLRQQAIWFRLTYFYFQESFERAIGVHRRILGELSDGNAAEAESLVREHIMDALQGFLTFLKDRNQKETQ
jgi:DNA-binding GntR family transcriptional regulator